jgi:hypothetical protein
MPFIVMQIQESPFLQGMNLFSYAQKSFSIGNEYQFMIFYGPFPDFPAGKTWPVYDKAGIGYEIALLEKERTTFHVFIVAYPGQQNNPCFG